MQEYSVAVVEVKDNVKDAVRRAMELVDWRCPSDSLLVKPNMINSKTSEEGVTTDPAVVSAIIEITKACGCKIYAGDSPGNAHPGKAREVFSLTGMLKAIEDSGAIFLEFENMPLKVVKTNGELINSIALTSCIFHHKIINVPKLKTHMQTLMTGAIKNLALGCIPGSGKNIMHKVGISPDRMAKAIIDVYSVIRPMVSLNIMDAIICMEGNGPTGGTPVKLNKILASKDALSLDMVAFKLAGVAPLKVPYVREAVKRGLGPKSYGDISVLGDPFEPAHFKLPPALVSRISSLAGYFAPIISPSVEIKREKCTGCGNCAEACPANAIEISRVATIDRSKCIRCYVCNEICEFDAIVVKRRYF